MDFKYFYPEQPKLINIEQPLLEKLSDDPVWVAEPKYNGNRLLLAMQGDEAQLWNRHGEQFSYTPDEALGDRLRVFAENTRGYCLFDGELRHNKVPGVKHKIVLWDVFVWDGTLQVGRTYQERRELFPWSITSENFSFTQQYLGNGVPFKPLFHSWTRDPEIEGMVIKNLKGRLNLGRTAGQSSSWMFKVRRPSNSYRF